MKKFNEKYFYEELKCIEWSLATHNYDLDSYIQRKKGNFSPSSLLINGHTITDQFSIAENFNNLFISIGRKLQHKIYPTRRDYSYYLQHPNSNTFFTSPTSPDKVKDIIQDLKTNRSPAPNSLPNKITT